MGRCSETCVCVWVYCNFEGVLYGVCIFYVCGNIMLYLYGYRVLNCILCIYTVFVWVDCI
jgi:hypothetical protein